MIETREGGAGIFSMRLLTCGAVRAMLDWEFLALEGDPTAHRRTDDFVWGQVFTSAGGTSEIQREITADRLLGLPRSR